MNDMTHNTVTASSSSATPRKPRIALMGEFSAGKSTLANLMIGAEPLPMQVIATQLPPVWITYGTDDPVRVDLEGNETPCDIAHLADCPIETTAYIRIQCEEDILQLCDLIDMPGISDPNMSSDVWARVLPQCDGVIWCTHATQAWRQSEAAVWDSLDEKLHRSSILLLTRSDMLLSERDKSRVLHRVKQETEDLFAATLMISLLQAREAENDPELWASCGAEPFVVEFLNVVHALSQELGSEPAINPFATLNADMPETTANADAPKVVPRRPKPVGRSTRRLSAEEASAVSERL